jgi:hypothetical protein
LKKQKAKKAGGAKKKEDKVEAPTETEVEAATEAPKDEDKPEDAASEPVEATSASPAPAEDDDEPSELAVPKPSHGRKPSVAVESRQRSESFFRSGASGGPLSPGSGVTSEVYREQAQKIEELEKENKRLASEAEESENRWKKGEEELEELREGRADVALAVEKGKEADALVCGYEGFEIDYYTNIWYRKKKLNRSNGNYHRLSHRATNRTVAPPHRRARRHLLTT